MKHTILNACLAAAVSMTCWAQPKPVTITTYPGSVVNDSRAQQIVSSGSQRLFDDNAQASCDANLAASAPLTVLMAQPSAVRFPADYDKICAVKADIHVVRSIASCSQFAEVNPDESNVFYGCSKVGCGMVVDINGLPNNSDLELLAESQWMHEYGHTRGLPDRFNDNLLMNPFLFADQFEVSTFECNKIKGKNPPPQAPTAVVPKIDVNIFVRQIYMHGVPLDQARTYTADEVNQVAGLLASCKAPNSDVCSDTPAGRQAEAGLPNVVLLIGVAGDKETALKLLVAFLARPPVDSPWFYQARLAVPLAIGYLLRRNPDDKLALHFLEAGTNLDVWQTQEMKLTSTESMGTTAVALTQNSILGLGLSRHPQALSFLQKLGQQVEKEQDKFFETQSAKDLINHAIKVNQSK